MADHLAHAAARAFQAEEAEHDGATEQPAQAKPEGFQAEGGEHARPAPEDTEAEIA